MVLKLKTPPAVPQMGFLSHSQQSFFSRSCTHKFKWILSRGGFFSLALGGALFARIWPSGGSVLFGGFAEL